MKDQCQQHQMVETSAVLQPTQTVEDDEHCIRQVSDSSLTLLNQSAVVINQVIKLLLTDYFYTMSFSLVFYFINIFQF